MNPSLFSVRVLRLYGVALLLPFFLGACATRPPDLAPDQTAEMQFSARADRLRDYSDWRTSGRAGFRAGQESASMSIAWRQRESGWVLDLRGPLASGSVRLQGDAESVVLRGSDGTEQQAGNAQLLLYQHTGYDMPVEVLRDWLRGLPSPEHRYSLELDEYGRPTQLEQLGWRIRYTAWTLVNGTYMPVRIFMDGAEISVRALLRDWELNHD